LAETSRRWSAPAWSTLSAALFTGFLLVVAATTVAFRTGWLGIDAVAASPARIASGKVWLLISSGLLVQKPLAVSLLSFAALGLLTLIFCGGLVLGASAVLGHVCSTLLTYGVLALVRDVSPETFRGIWSAPDYGVSAIAAAWLGAVASVFWRRRGSTIAGKAPVAISCLAVAAFGWMVRRHLNVLDSEHVLAFAIGVAVSKRFAAPKSTFAWRLAAQRQARQFAFLIASGLVALVGASIAEAVRPRELPKFSNARVATIARKTFALPDSGRSSLAAIARRDLRAVDPFFVDWNAMRPRRHP
jgi:hypothetical protein